VAHAVETAASLKRNETSRRRRRQAWGFAEPTFERVMWIRLMPPARGICPWLAHCRVGHRNSCLGQPTRVANFFALTALCDTVHGVAVGLMAPPCRSFNAAAGENPYSVDARPHALADRLTRMLTVAGLPGNFLKSMQCGTLPKLARSPPNNGLRH